MSKHYKTPSEAQLSVTAPPSLPSWLNRFDGLAEDGVTPITKAAWSRSRAAFLQPQPAQPTGKAAAPWLTQALLNESIAILSHALPAIADAALHDRIIAHDAALQVVLQKRATISAAAAQRCAAMRANIANRTGRKVNLEILGPSGAHYKATSYKQAAAITGYSPATLKVKVSQGSGTATLGRGENNLWRVTKLA